MSKERLEEIKNTKWENLRTSQIIHVKWLIEQAERLHGTNHKMGYIDMYADCNRLVGSDSMKIYELEQQNKRYLEVIEKVRSYMETDAIMTFDQDERLEGIHEVLVDFYKEESE